MQNVVPGARADADLDTAAPDDPVARQFATRALAGRSVAYADEVRRLIRAGYAVMRRTGGDDPRVSDIVRESGLSNQAFYRHFTGKDELLVAILDDGQRQLVEYLEHRMARARSPEERIRRWIEGVMEQARNADAAENSRPFAVNGMRLADRFPAENERTRERIRRPLRDAVAEVGGDPRRDADAVSHMVMATMNEALVTRVRPSRDEVEHLVDFVLRGLGAG